MKKKIQLNIKQIPFASFSDRLAAYLLDQLFMLPVYIGILLVVSIKLEPYVKLTPWQTLLPSLETLLSQPVLEKAFNLTRVFLHIFSGLYFIYFTFNQGATPGKKVMGLMVIRRGLKKPNLWQTIIRETAGKWVSGIFYLGYIWMLFDKDKQTWHDKLANTAVIRHKPNKTAKTFVLGGFLIIVIVSAAIIGNFISFNTDISKIYIPEQSPTFIQ